MTATERLAAARRLLEQETLGPAGPRAATFLARISLEEWVAASARERGLGADGVPFRVLLLGLRQVHPQPELIKRAAATWNGLSRACHAYGNELPPAERTVLGWIEAVEELLARTDRA